MMYSLHDLDGVALHRGEENTHIQNVFSSFDITARTAVCSPTRTPRKCTCERNETEKAR